MEKCVFENIYIEIVGCAYKKAIGRFMPLMSNEMEEIQTKIATEAVCVASTLNVIDAKQFKEFINEAQVKDLLVNGIVSMILGELNSVSSVKLAIADNCINYCLGVLENNYPSLTNDESVWAIKEFLEALFSAKDFHSYLNSDEKKDEHMILREFVHRIGEDEKQIYRESVQRVENGLAIDFVGRNKVFEDVKNTYQKAMKQIYQMGFIYFVGEFKFNEFYISPILAGGTSFDFNFSRNWLLRDTASSHRMLRDNWKNIFRNNDIIYVIGGPGYGKSLFLRNIINNYTKLNVEGIQEYLLIYCDLKAFYNSGDVRTKTVLDFLRESMIGLTGLHNITIELIQYFLNRGRCVILLDALDEVPKEVRQELHKKVIGFFSTSNPNNKICITSRDRGFFPQSDISVYHILPLSSYDIDEYLNKMISLKKFKKDEKATFMQQAKILIDKGFLNNFLVLSLLVNIYKAEKELPENKIDLYKKCFDYIAKKREEEKSKIGYNWTNIYPLMKDSTFISLSTLAVPNNCDIKREDVEELLKKQYKTKYADEATAEYAIKEFLDFCSNRTELFVPSAVDDKFKFFHRSFFEYFYARYIHQQTTVEEMYKLMVSFDIDSELFELVVALVKEDNEIKYQELLDYIFDKVEMDVNSTTPDYIAFGILTLAMQVIDDIFYINKYVEFVLNNSDYMKNEKVYMMNQLLIKIWTIKGIGEDKQNKDKFRNAYEAECIQFVLSMFYDLRNVDIRDTRDDMETYLRYERHLIYKKNVSKSGFGCIPFFWRVYREYFDICKVINAFERISFAEWLKKQSGLDRKQKNTLKKGFQVYGTFSDKQRKNFLEYYAERK